MKHYFKPAIRIRAIGNYDEMLQSSLTLNDEKGDNNQKSKDDGELETFEEKNETYYLHHNVWE